MEKIRAFIALNLPKSAKSDIKVIQERLKERFPGQVNWLPPEQIHLTVAFLGDRTKEEIKKIGQILDKLAEKQTAVVLRPHYVRSFSHVIAIKMLSKKIRTFYADLVLEFQKQGIEYQERRKFKPHITIGRLTARLPKKFKGSSRFPGFKIEKIDLIKSTLETEGAEYEIISRHPFRLRSLPPQDS